MVRVVGDQFFGKQNVKKVDSNLKEDDIKSIQFAKMIDLLCHGEIEGVKLGSLFQSYSYLENIFLDDTQVQDVNGRQNFSDVTIDLRNGTANQEIITLIDAIENTRSVSREVDRSPYNTAVSGVYFINNSNREATVVKKGSSDSGYRISQLTLFGDTISSQPAFSLLFIYQSNTHLFKVNEFVNIERTTTGFSSLVRSAKVIEVGNAEKDNVPGYKYIFIERPSKYTSTTNDAQRDDPLTANVMTSVGVSATTSNINASTIDFDKLRVTLQFPDLSKLKDNGTTDPLSVNFGIHIIENDGTTHYPFVNETVKGIAVRGYTRDYEIDLNTLRAKGTFSKSGSHAFELEFDGRDIKNLQGGQNINIKFLDGNGTLFNKTIENVQLAAASTYSESYDKTTFSTSINGDALGLADEEMFSNDGQYKRIFNIGINSLLSSFPLTIKVVRNDLDETNAKFRNKIVFQSFTEIKSEQRPYNNFALAGLRFDAEQFGRYPSRKYLVQGTKIKIPAPDSEGNTPEVIRTERRSRELGLGTFGTIKHFNFIYYPPGYVFNGTLTTTKVFTNDPAWILYDLLTTSKGFGEHIQEDKLDIYSFFEASKYSSELLTLSDGTKEPRFACNVILGQKKDAYQVIRDFCSAMNAVPFYSVGSLKLSQDKPTDVSYIFGLANVTEVGFVYNSTAQKTKFTQCTVSYFDNEVQDLQIANVFLKDLHSNLTGVENAFGKNIKNLKTFGCTSRTQAIRAAKWFLLTQFTRGETVSFSVTVEAGVIVRPGQVIAIQDPLKTNDRTSGRVVSATTNTDNNTSVITVDDVEKTNLDSTGTSSLQLTIVLDQDQNENDPNLSSQYVETKQILSIDLAQKTITTDKFRRDPLPNTFYVVDRQVNNVSSLPKYKIVSISEGKNDGTYSVTAVLYNELIYSIVESVDTISVEPVQTVIDLPSPPTNLEAVENIILQDNRATSVINVSWTPVNGVKEYLLEFTVGTGDIKKSPKRIKTSEINFDIFNFTQGDYEFSIKSINAFGQQSNEAVQIKRTFLGKTKAPSNVSNLFVETVSDELIKIKFDKSTEIDVLHGGFVAYCYDSNTDGSGSFFLDNDTLSFPGNSSEIIVQNLPGEHMLKFIDDGGRASLNSTSIVINTTPASNVQYNDIKKQTTAIVQTIAEHTTSPKFQGFPGLPLFNTEFNSLLDALTLTNTGVTSGSAAYLFKDILDLKQVATVQLEKVISAVGISNVNWDDHVGDVDTFRSWDQLPSAETFDISVKLRVQSTNNAPSGSSYVINDFDGCPFVEVTNSTFRGRGFRFVLELFCRNLNQNIKVKQLGCNVKINRRTETSIQTLTTSSSQDTVVTFDKPFFAGDASLTIGANLKPHVEVTVLNLTTGDTISVTSITNTNFTINVLDSNSQRVARNFTFVAIGYG